MIKLTFRLVALTVNPELLTFTPRARAALVRPTRRCRTGTTVLLRGTSLPWGGIFLLLLIVIIGLELIEPRATRPNPPMVVLTVCITKLTIVVIHDHPTDVLH